MAFPQVAAANGGYDGGTSHTVNLPSNISYGDLLLVFFAISSQTYDITFPEGWTELFDASTTLLTFVCYYRVADGEEGASIEVTTSGWCRSAHTTYRVTGYSGTPEAGTAVTGEGTAPDPPSLTPTWGAKDTLWLAAVGYFAGTATVTAYPTNYSNGRNDRYDDENGVGVGAAQRELNATSEDPGTFTLSAWSQLISNTVAVQPAAGVTEKSSSDTGSGAEASTQTATLTEAETGTGVEGLLARILGLTETGAGLDAVAQAQAVLEGAETGSGSDLLSQAQAILGGAEAGSGVDAYVSLEIQQAKVSSDTGSGVEGAPVHSAVLAGSETGSGIEDLIDRLLAAFDSGAGAEVALLSGDKVLLATELGEGIDALVVKKEIFAGGEGTKFFGGGHRPPHRAS